MWQYWDKGYGSKIYKPLELIGANNDFKVWESSGTVTSLQEEKQVIHWSPAGALKSSCSWKLLQQVTNIAPSQELGSCWDNINNSSTTQHSNKSYRRAQLFLSFSDCAKTLRRLLDAIQRHTNKNEIKLKLCQPSSCCDISSSTLDCGCLKYNLFLWSLFSKPRMFSYVLNIKTILNQSIKLLFFFAEGQFKRHKKQR